MSSSLPTPNIAHLTAEDYDHVYEPAGERLAGSVKRANRPASRRGLLHPSRCTRTRCGAATFEITKFVDRDRVCSMAFAALARGTVLIGNLARSGSGVVSVFLANLLGPTKTSEHSREQLSMPD